MTRALLPLAFALVLVPLPAQIHQLSCSLLLRTHRSDLVVTGDLLTSIVPISQWQAALRKACADEALACESPAFTFVGNPAPGTHVVELSIDIKSTVTWNDALDGRATDALAELLDGRLSSCFYDLPRRELLQHAAELQERYATLSQQRAASDLQRSAAAAAADALRQQDRDLDQQAIAARFDLAIAQRTLDHLREARQQMVKLRDEALAIARRQAAARAAAQQEIQRLERLSGKSDSSTTPEEVRNNLDRLQKLQAELQDLSDQYPDDHGDAQQMLTVVLEQLPTATLSLERAKARIEYQERARAELAAKLENATLTQLKLASSVEGDLAGVELAVCRELLTEVQGKLQRLEPIEVTRLQ